MIPILILAAGTSSRMRGGDKLLEEVRGEPLLRLQAQRALRTGHPVYVALAPASDARAAAIADLDVMLLTIPEATEGMSGTMRGAVAKLPEAGAFMMFLGDLVALETEDLERVFKAREDEPDQLIWRGATATGKPGHPIIFDASLRANFAKLTGDTGGEALVNPLRAQTFLVRFEDDRARLDLDTPEEWAAWRASLAEK
ncbi:nucleotidyltransferase family protein [Cognatiyoonia sp. IB215446]|uniref:nucleotidyltransferase family protein n=1 Tax=Cognatiyoonia sp. IB215446 TaxID=3097355 RepID=UPI002A154A5A|nr:nucleotidyltransferase family protein [Cognatiyoonia sp. IB215446]MDX8348979.1 nucleotidyltransferase family protein [Cognatiyoonia sp. IB215446]